MRLKYATALLAISCTAWLGGCGPSTDTAMKTATPFESQGRIEVTRIGVIPDGLAYDNKRGIYVIKDRKTGAEYIGISGIGITEVGSHMAGKVLVPDER